MGFAEWASGPTAASSSATAHRTWEKWASASVVHHPLKAALLLNYDPSAPSRAMPIIAEQQGTNLTPADLCAFMDFVRRNDLQKELFSIGPNQFLVTSIHEHWFCARCVNTSKPAGEGAIVMQAASFLLVALYEGSVGAASSAMAAVDRFVSPLGRRNPNF
ncbi:unnamed protein product [Spirodela intermedia]|uniref:Uncharacterized protein n=1 Tax=Spirodela intermedia TaxID=51605 RepID=A0A7I8JST4_SPIIN|nr:unnamed protein product [Spirodela intermedia]CAA6673250.1 unnamed protein product [Spirodela intermedia]